ncbi:MAG: hypothetical protein CL912_33595 [Deltaproteobacteria bacterium]|nr:hypothetical protein [Deltaproteobacteria bacterium]
MYDMRGSIPSASDKYTLCLIETYPLTYTFIRKPVPAIDETLGDDAPQAFNRIPNRQSRSTECCGLKYR